MHPTSTTSLGLEQPSVSYCPSTVVWAASSRPARCREDLSLRPAFQKKGKQASAQANQSDTLYTANDPTETRQRLFGDIAPVYDELNEKLSFGQHRVWKRMAVKWAGAKPGQKCLDVCCGSGDLAFELSRAAGSSGKVVALDFAEEMLQYARQREDGQQPPRGSLCAEIEWVLGDATNLPFSNAEFDAATMGYGLRNVASIPQALRELRRVLKPGCKVSILDFNNASVSNPLVDGLQAWALENVVVPAARSYGLEAEYQYLRPSIQAFPTGREQETMAKQAGFRKAVHYEIAFGLMGMLVAEA